MKTRKYLSEFGVNVFTNFETIIPAEHLDIVKYGRSYHIYSIMATPKMRILHDSIVQEKNILRVRIEKQVEENFKEIQVGDIMLDPNLDHTKLSISTKYPYNNMIIEITDSVWLSTYGKTLKNNKFY